MIGSGSGVPKNTTTGICTFHWKLHFNLCSHHFGSMRGVPGGNPPHLGQSAKPWGGSQPTAMAAHGIQRKHLSSPPFPEPPSRPWVPPWTHVPRRESRDDLNPRGSVNGQSPRGAGNTQTHGRGRHASRCLLRGPDHRCPGVPALRHRRSSAVLRPGSGYQGHWWGGGRG